jgi:hypothetical protein
MIRIREAIEAGRQGDSLEPLDFVGVKQYGGTMTDCEADREETIIACAAPARRFA